MELESRLLKTKPAAKYLDCSPWKMRDLAHKGIIPHIVIGDDGRDWRFDRADLDKFIDERRTVA